MHPLNLPSIETLPSDKNTLKYDKTEAQLSKNGSKSFFAGLLLFLFILQSIRFNWVITISLQSITVPCRPHRSQKLFSKAHCLQLFLFKYSQLMVSDWFWVYLFLGRLSLTFLMMFTIQDKIHECPILKPNEKQFQNFLEFVTKAENKYKDNYGMVRVVPPKSWKPNSKTSKENLDHLLVSGPIEQNIYGKGGVYEAIHIQKKSMTLKEYKQKVCPFDKMTQQLPLDEAEAKFWKNICFSPPLYGADIHNTLMDEKAGAWNLNDLQSVVKYSMEDKCRGVNTPYVYVGSWKTFFAWHKEDLDLSAINYLHSGKSKFWYSIPPSQSALLQKVAKRHFPQHFAQCSEHLRHKTSLINPYLLKNQCPQLKICKTQHKKNEFILVFGGAYHTGFNFGFNVAEAVNYGTAHWLQQVTDVKHCRCERSSVKINLFELKNTLQKSPIAKTSQFKNFAEKVYDMESKETEEEVKIDEMRAVKSMYSKKIRKNPKAKVEKLTYKGEQYDVENWAQCQKCKIWRKTKKPLKQSEHFHCKLSDRRCNQKEKERKDYIVL